MKPTYLLCSLLWVVLTFFRPHWPALAMTGGDMRYVFRLSNNRLRWPSDTSLTTQVESVPPPDLFWHLTYHFSHTQLLPATIPLLVVSDDQNSGLFVFTAAEADGVKRQLCGPVVAGQSLPQLQVQPLFAYLSVEWTLAVNEQACPAITATPGLSELLAVREADNSLTVLFRQHDESVAPHRYLLTCAATQEQRALWHRHFLWAGLSIFANRHSFGELIFQVADFSCQGQVHLLDLLTKQQLTTTIVNVEELYAAN